MLLYPCSYQFKWLLTNLRAGQILDTRVYYFFTLSKKTLKQFFCKEHIKMCAFKKKTNQQY